jgi:hypothetical protein
MIVGAAITLELARVLGDKVEPGWGPAIGNVLALLLGMSRLVVQARSRRYAGADPVEEMLR